MNEISSLESKPVEHSRVGRKLSSSLKKTHIAVYMSEDKKEIIQAYCDAIDKTTAQLGRELFDKLLNDEEFIK